MTKICRRSFLAVMVCAVALCRAALSQGSTGKVRISGVVIDPVRRPIAGAEILFVGTKATAFSDSSGLFRVSTDSAAELLMQVRRPGYQSVLIKLQGSWNGIILLQPGRYQLPDVEVTARYAKPARYAGTAKYDDYFRRRRQGIGEFIDREELEQRSPLRTADILEGRAGIKVVDDHVTNTTFVAFARCNEYPPMINIYVDGRRVIPHLGYSGSMSPFTRSKRDPEIAGTVGEMLSRLSPSDIELVEIFRGPSELPPEFNDGNCGAIVIWTRQGGR